MFDAIINHHYTPRCRHASPAALFIDYLLPRCCAAARRSGVNDDTLLLAAGSASIPRCCRRLFEFLRVMTIITLRRAARCRALYAMLGLPLFMLAMRDTHALFEAMLFTHFAPPLLAAMAFYYSCCFDRLSRVDTVSRSIRRRARCSRHAFCLPSRCYYAVCARDGAA